MSADEKPVPDLPDGYMAALDEGPSDVELTDPSGELIAYFNNRGAAIEAAWAHYGRAHYARQSAAQEGGAPVAHGGHAAVGSSHGHPCQSAATGDGAAPWFLIAPPEQP